MADPEVADRLRLWLARAAPHVTLERCVQAAEQALATGRDLSAVRCATCQELTLDEGAIATRRHTLHVCHWGHRFRLHAPGSEPIPVSGNPLAVWGPQLRDRALWVTQLPRAAPSAAVIFGHVCGVRAVAVEMRRH